MKTILLPHCHYPFSSYKYLSFQNANPSFNWRFLPFKLVCYYTLFNNLPSTIHSFQNITKTLSALQRKDLFFLQLDLFISQNYITFLYILYSLFSLVLFFLCLFTIHYKILSPLRLKNSFLTKTKSLSLPAGKNSRKTEAS